MAFTIFKKPKIDDNFTLYECCICGELGHYGFTDIYQISLRENNLSLNFSDVVFFTVGVNVEKDSSDICGKCKPKIIEFYHFKKRSQSVQKKFNPLLQEIMKIVGNYVSQYSIKAVKIEESKEKLTIMEKIPTENSTNLKISEVSSICDLQIKQASDGQEDGGRNDTEINPQIEIKKEPEEPPEIYDRPNIELQPIKHETVESQEEYTIDTKLDVILDLNQQILELVKHLTEHNLLNSSK